MQLQETLSQDLALKSKLETELQNAKTLNGELGFLLEKKKGDEAELDQQVNKERVSKLDMEVEISRLRSENGEALKKLDTIQMTNLDLMVDMEDMRNKMEQDVTEIAKLQKDLKQAIQDRIALQERLSEVTRVAFFLVSFFFFDLYFIRAQSSPGRKRNWQWRKRQFGASFFDQHQQEALDENQLAGRKQRKEDHARYEKPPASKNSRRSFFVPMATGVLINALSFFLLLSSLFSFCRPWT